MACGAPCSSVEILGTELFSVQAAEWDDLLRRSYDNRIFFTSSWLRLWWHHLGAGAPRVLLLRDEARIPAAILPLRIVARDGERVATLLGDHNVADYMDALAEKQHAQRHLAGLWKCALADLGWDRVELRHIPSGSPLLPALRSACEEVGLDVTIEPDEVCPVAILCSNWEGYLQMLTKKQRHEIRRKLRRAQDDAVWDWRVTRAQRDLDEDLRVFFHLHEASAREKERFMTPPMRAFFASIAADLLDSGAVRLGIFRREGVDVAATMSFHYRGRYLLYNSGYDPAYGTSNPGIAAVALTMQDAIAVRAAAFDFLSGDEPYKYQFGASNTYTSRATVLAKQ